MWISLKNTLKREEEGQQPSLNHREGRAAHWLHSPLCGVMPWWTDPSFLFFSTKLVRFLSPNEAFWSSSWTLKAVKEPILHRSEPDLSNTALPIQPSAALEVSLCSYFLILDSHLAFCRNLTLREMSHSFSTVLRKSLRKLPPWLPWLQPEDNQCHHHGQWNEEPTVGLNWQTAGLDELEDFSKVFCHHTKTLVGKLD